VYLGREVCEIFVSSMSGIVFGIDYSVCVDVWKERLKRESVCGREEIFLETKA